MLTIMIGTQSCYCVSYIRRFLDTVSHTGKIFAVIKKDRIRPKSLKPALSSFVPQRHLESERDHSTDEPRRIQSVPTL
ncbi:hypothetical protein AC578_6979 [Pseudocercospora eumusae]|uniref:Uncharacterized protein n=1 Tax=Pseudocercospora eumusae TaxID=321146 RepID=A0A139GZB6_9PEZI|nr:hypothetical protein AC578_6979 [Pseudocercospora eumusae]